MWGKNDLIFVPAGAEAFRKDVDESRLEIKFVEAGHFTVETNEGVHAASNEMGRYVGRAE